MTSIAITSRKLKAPLYLFTLGLFLAFFAASYAYAQNECLDSVRNKIIANPPQLSNAALTSLGVTKENLASLPRLEENFIRTSSDDGKTITTLRYEYQIETATAVLEVEYEINGKDAGAINEEFSFTSDMTISTKDDLPKAEESAEYNYLTGCKKGAIELNQTVFNDYTINDKFANATWRYKEKNQPLKQGTKQFPVKDIGPNSPETIAKNYFFFDSVKLPDRIISQVSIMFPFDDDTKYQISPVEDSERLNLATNKIEKYRGASVKMWDNAGSTPETRTPEIRFHQYRAASGAMESHGFILSIPYHEQSISKTSFLKSVLSPSKEYAATVRGFSQNDWDAADLSYDLKNSNYKLDSYDNYQNYYSFSGSTIFLTAHVDMPTPLPASSPTLLVDEKYLRATKYIQPDSVRVLAQQIPPQTTRLALAMEIVKKVNETITYDYDQVNDGLVSLMSTDEILKKRKGVCQHYANLFTAIARAKGLPARIIFGFFLNSGETAGLHAWVEFKINNETWWPLEPQQPGATYLPNRAYFPIAVQSGYEVLSSTPLQEAQDDDKASTPLYQRYFELIGANFEKH